MSRSDLRLVGPAVVVWAGMWLVTGWRWGLWLVVALAGVSLAVISLAARRVRHQSNRARLWALAVMLTASVAVGGLRVWGLATGPLARAAADGRVVEADLIVNQARLTPQWGTVMVDATVTRMVIGADHYTMRQPVSLSASQASDWLGLMTGTTVTVTARLATAQWDDGVAAKLKVLAGPNIIRPPPAWQRLIESMRDGLSRAMLHSPADQAALVPGLVVGDVSAMSAQLTQDFKTTALTHLTAVSGFNLAIMTSFLLTVASAIGVKGRALSLLAAGAIGLYVVLCHDQPSIVRAAAMALVSLASLGRGDGSASGLRALSLAVIGLCWIDPWMSRSVGFELSVLATFGIIWWGARWTERLASWLPNWLASAMAVPLAAQLATQPVICWLSGAISVSGLMANAAASPWMAPATIIGLAACYLSPLSPTLAGWLGYVAGWCAEPIILVGRGLAHVPGSSHPWPATAVGLVVVTAACVAVARLMPAVLGRRWAVILASAVLVAAMVSPPYQPGWPGAGWRIAACDVGQGDGVVVRAGGGQAVVIDVGPPQSGMVTCLRQLKVTAIPLLVLTHFHADHVGSLDEVLTDFPVSVILAPGFGSGGPQVAEVAREHGLALTLAVSGAQMTVGDVHLLVVSAFQPTSGSADAEESSAENDASLAVRLDTPEMSLLETGDLEITGQQAALAWPDLLRVDVLKVPHHGSSRQDASFLAATQARFALISVGAGNSYGHPADRTVNELIADGMTVIRTDEHGSITVADAGGWSIMTQR